MPQKISLNWQPNPPQYLSQSFPEQLALWTAESLTAAYRARGSFAVTLQHLGACADETWFDFGNEKPWVRDVLLLTDGKESVWARSVCAADSRWQALLDCGTQPLGERLFNGSLPLVRSALEFADIRGLLLPNGSKGLLARRSWFDWEGEKMGLVECFLA